MHIILILVNNMINKSIWINKDNNDIEEKLKENIECDILIIGGGIAGLSTAYYLKESNKKIVLIDKDRIGYGATSKNTGKLDYMQGLIYHKIEKNYNKEIAKIYLDSQKEAINEVVNIIKKKQIPLLLIAGLLLVTLTKSFKYVYR